jgi:hypothetical protein
LNVAFGSVVVVIVGAAGRPTVIDSGFVAVCCGFPESLTLNVAEVVPVEVGVPLITPDELSGLNPAGKEPLTMSHVIVPVPPEAVNVKL